MFRTKAQAYALGRLTAKKLKTTGWRLAVWENVYWYVALVHTCGLTVNVEAVPGRPVKYWAVLGQYEQGGFGVRSGSVFKRFEDPNKAVQGAIVMARWELAPYVKALEAARELVRAAKSREKKRKVSVK